MATVAPTQVIDLRDGGQGLKDLGAGIAALAKGLQDAQKRGRQKKAGEIMEKVLSGELTAEEGQGKIVKLGDTELSVQMLTLMGAAEEQQRARQEVADKRTGALATSKRLHPDKTAQERFDSTLGLESEDIIDIFKAKTARMTAEAARTAAGGVATREDVHARMPDVDPRLLEPYIGRPDAIKSLDKSDIGERLQIASDNMNRDSAQVKVVNYFRNQAREGNFPKEGQFISMNDILQASTEIGLTHYEAVALTNLQSEIFPQLDQRLSALGINFRAGETQEKIAEEVAKEEELGAERKAYTIIDASGNIIGEGVVKTKKEVDELIAAGLTVEKFVPPTTETVVSPEGDVTTVRASRSGARVVGEPPRKALTDEAQENINLGLSSLEQLRLMESVVADVSFPVLGGVAARIAEIAGVGPKYALFRSNKRNFVLGAQSIIKGIPSNYDVKDVLMPALPEEGVGEATNRARIKVLRSVTVNMLENVVAFHKGTGKDIPPAILSKMRKAGVDVDKIEAFEGTDAEFDRRLQESTWQTIADNASTEVLLGYVQDLSLHPDDLNGIITRSSPENLEQLFQNKDLTSEDRTKLDAAMDVIIGAGE